MYYKAIIFDFGNVLLQWNPERIFDNEFQTKAEFKEFLDFISPFHLCTDAGLPFEAIFPLVIQQYPEKKALIHKWMHHFERSIEEPIAENVEILKYLKTQTSLYLFGLTNFYGPLCRKIIVKYDFFSLLDDIIISGEVGLVKPYEKIYTILPQKYDLKKEECVFIDDSLFNIKMAEQLGIKTIHFTESTNLQNELKKLSIL